MTTLLSETERRDRDFSTNPPPSDADVAVARADVAEKGTAVKSLKEQKAEKGEIKVAVEALNKAKEELSRLEERAKAVPGLPRTASGSIDYGVDFFSRQAFLTVSGQLQVSTFFPHFWSFFSPFFMILMNF